MARIAAFHAAIFLMVLQVILTLPSEILIKTVKVLFQKKFLLRSLQIFWPRLLKFQLLANFNLFNGFTEEFQSRIEAVKIWSK